MLRSYPTSITIAPPFDLGSQVFQLLNDYDSRVALKIKVTDSQCFAVHPVFSVIPIKGYVAVSIGARFRQGAPDPSKFYNVYVKYVANSSLTQFDDESTMKKFWATLDDRNYPTIKIPIIFKTAQPSSSPEESAQT